MINLKNAVYFYLYNKNRDLGEGWKNAIRVKMGLRRFATLPKMLMTRPLYHKCKNILFYYNKREQQDHYVSSFP